MTRQTHARPRLRSSPSRGPTGPQWTRIDSTATPAPPTARRCVRLGVIGIPSALEPEQVYGRAKARGMDLVTITDHDTIAGAMTLKSGFEGFIIGEEVTVFFPEDRCKLHVNVWDMTPEARGDRNTRSATTCTPSATGSATAACPTRWRTRSTFRTAGSAYGISNAACSSAGSRSLTALGHAPPVHRAGSCGGSTRTSARSASSTTSSRLRPATGQRTHGRLRRPRLAQHRAHVHGDQERPGEKITDPARSSTSSWRAARPPRAGRTHPRSWRTFTTVASHYTARKLTPDMDAGQRYLASKLLRFAGVPTDTPSKASRHMASASCCSASRAGACPSPRQLPQTDRARARQIPGPARAVPAGHVGGRLGVSQHDRGRVRRRPDRGSQSHGIRHSTRRATRQERHRRPPHQLLRPAGRPGPRLQPFLSEQGARRGADEPPAEPGSGAAAAGKTHEGRALHRHARRRQRRVPIHPERRRPPTKLRRDFEVITSTTFDVPSGATSTTSSRASTSIPSTRTCRSCSRRWSRCCARRPARSPMSSTSQRPAQVGLVGHRSQDAPRARARRLSPDFPALTTSSRTTASLGDQTLHALVLQPFSASSHAPATTSTRSKPLGLERDKCLSLQPGVDTEIFDTRFADADYFPNLGGEGEVNNQTSSRETVRVLYVGRVSVGRTCHARQGLEGDRQARTRSGPRGRACGRGRRTLPQGDGEAAQTHTDPLPRVPSRRRASTIYASSNIFAFTSTTDTLGRVVMERRPRATRCS